MKYTIQNTKQTAMNLAVLDGMDPEDCNRHLIYAGQLVQRARRVQRSIHAFLSKAFPNENYIGYGVEIEISIATNEILPVFRIEVCGEIDECLKIRTCLEKAVLASDEHLTTIYRWIDEVGFVHRTEADGVGLFAYPLFDTIEEEQIELGEEPFSPHQFWAAREA